jgi:hypothetical protein
MTRKLHDQFSKSFLTDLLAQAGNVQPGYVLSSEVKEIDLLFQPDARAISALEPLRLLGRMAAKFCLIEPYRNPVSQGEVEVCISRALEVSLLQRRQAKQQKIPLKQVALPDL